MTAINAKKMKINMHHHENTKTNGNFLSRCRITNLLCVPISFGVALLLLMFAFSACNKLELDLLDFKSFKVYDDTLANADNPSVNIAAGNGRIFMTYGTAYYGTMTSYQLDVQNVKSVVMATDNEGNLLWKASIPDAMEKNALVALDDGGCLLATQVYWGSVPGYIADNVYLFRYDRDGNMTKIDSVPFVPNITDALYMDYIGACKKSNGNIIFYGDAMYWGGGSYQNRKGWMMEYSPNTGLVWIKEFYFPKPGNPIVDIELSGCVETPDNGFLLFGYIGWADSSVNYTTYLYLMKTNATGDTLWTKYLTPVTNVWPRNMVKASNGNYWFCYNSNLYITSEPSVMNIYEINQQGDSVNAVTVNNEFNNISNMIIATNDGGCFTLMNQAVWNSIGYNPQFTSFFRQTNSRKVYFDSQLNKISDSRFQTMTTDFLTQTCMTSDGSIACFGLTQPIGKTYYLPQLYILK